MILRCPVARCRTENASPITHCVSCGADLRAYAAAQAFGAICFNQALGLAREGKYAESLDRLAAGQASCPQDDEARMLEADVAAALGDEPRARAVWKWLAENAQDQAVRQRALKELETQTGGKKKATSKKKRKRRKRHKKKRK